MEYGEKHVAVTFAIEAAEAAAIEWAAPRIVGPRNFVVLIHQDGQYELELMFGDVDLRDGRMQALDAYRRIREEARLPPARKATVTGVVPTRVAAGDPSHDYIGDAEDFLDQHHHEYAVVAAQIACEVEIRMTFEALALSESGPMGRSVLNVIRGFALQDRGSQRLLAEAGHPVTTLPWWSTYREHVERRHNVVHRGAKLTEEDAQASVDVMWELIEFMRVVRASAQRASGPPS